MNVYGWHAENIWQEVSFQFANFCTLIKNDWLAMLHIEPEEAQSWPQQPTSVVTPDWDKELAHARELNAYRQQSAATLWMDKSIYEPGEKPEVWDDSPVVPAQIQAFEATIKLLKSRHVQVVVIIDSINRRAVQNPELVQPAVTQATAILKANQIPYLDMYSMPYQEGWNWDRLHPTDWHGYRWTALFWRVLNDEKRYSPFFLYLLLAVTIIAWSSVDESMNLKVHFEYQKF